MRKLVVLAFVTLDGVMQAPGGPDEDTSGGFTCGGWSVGYWDDFMNKVMGEQMGKPFDLLLGRKTYDIFAAYWPNSQDPGAAELNRATKYVVSTTLKRPGWEKSILIASNVPQEVQRLKNQDGPELQVHGSSNLIQTLLKHDLVDAFLLKIFPVTVGPGKRLFGEGAIPASFKVRDSGTSPQGVIVATYERDGDIKAGTFGPG